MSHPTRSNLSKMYVRLKLKFSSKFRKAFTLSESAIVPDIMSIKTCLMLTKYRAECLNVVLVPFWLVLNKNFSLHDGYGGLNLQPLHKKKNRISGMKLPTFTGVRGAVF